MHAGTTTMMMMMMMMIMMLMMLMIMMLSRGRRITRIHRGSQHVIPASVHQHFIIRRCSRVWFAMICLNIFKAHSRCCACGQSLGEEPVAARLVLYMPSIVFWCLYFCGCSIATASAFRSKATIPPRAYAARFAVHFTQHIVAVEDKVW